MESFRDQITRGSLSIDQDLNPQERSTNDCLAIKLKRKEINGPVSAVLTFLNCNEKTNVMCSKDLFQTKVVDKKAKFSCLQAKNTSSMNDNKHDKRMKRDVNDERTKNSATRKHSNCLYRYSCFNCFLFIEIYIQYSYNCPKFFRFQA